MRHVIQHDLDDLDRRAFDPRATLRVNSNMTGSGRCGANSAHALSLQTCILPVRPLSTIDNHRMAMHNHSVNKPLLYIVLFVLFVFGAGLIVIGASSREQRKLEYLEMTHRITSGHGTEDD